MKPMLTLQIPFGTTMQAWRERLSCHAPDCRGSRRLWGRISDGAGSVRIHGRRYCFPHCFDGELRRRFGDLPDLARRWPRPAHRIPLGLLMLSRGELTHQQLRFALDAQRQNGTGRIGEWIQRLGYARESQITAALGEQWKCPVLRSLPASTADCGIPFHLLSRFQMAPIHYGRSARILHIAFATDVEYRALLAIEQMLDCKAEPCLANGSALRALLARVEEHRRGTNVVFEDVRGPDEMTRITSGYAAKLGAEDIRLVACGEYVWVRIVNRKISSNLLFRPVLTEVTAMARTVAIARVAGW